ncbi:hypothetical protein BC830DRAFT_1124232 [Chytriomyces sp. MP71]|nr:hypothetical protein BC830DRAFT_1124232 [Chytriomyces sp. MP71]
MPYAAMRREGARRLRGLLLVAVVRWLIQVQHPSQHPQRRKLEPHSLDSFSNLGFGGGGSCEGGLRMSRRAKQFRETTTTLTF